MSHFNNKSLWHAISLRGRGKDDGFINLSGRRCNWWAVLGQLHHIDPSPCAGWEYRDAVWRMCDRHPRRDGETKWKKIKLMSFVYASFSGRVKTFFLKIPLGIATFCSYIISPTLEKFKFFLLSCRKYCTSLWNHMLPRSTAYISEVSKWSKVIKWKDIILPFSYCTIIAPAISKERENIIYVRCGWEEKKVICYN